MELAAALGKLLILLLLPVENLDHLHAGEVFGQEGIQSRQPGFAHLVGPAGEGAEHHGQNGHHRHHHKRQQRHTHVQQQHHRRQADDLHRVFEQLHQDGGVQLVDRLHVVGDAGDDLSHRGQIEKPHGQALHVFKELPAHLIDDLLSRPLQQQELDPVAHEQSRQKGHVLPRRDKHAGKALLHRLAGGVVPGDIEVDGVPGEDRLVEFQSGDGQHQRQAERHGPHVGLHVGEHPQHRAALIVDVGGLLCFFVQQTHAYSPPSSRSCFSSCCLS